MMNFSDTKTFTYYENTVVVDGEALEVPTTLPAAIECVQFHKGRGVLEEPLMVEVPTSKYEAVLQEWLLIKTNQPVIPEAEIVRKTRNEILSGTDFTQLADYPKESQTLYATYRQELRDISLQADFPENVTWPESPQGEIVL